MRCSMHSIALQFITPYTLPPHPVLSAQESELNKVAVRHGGEERLSDSQKSLKNCFLKILEKGKGLCEL